MACDTISDILTRETGRFYGEIYKRVFNSSPWISLTKRDSFPDGMGITLSNLTYERSAPTTAEPTWSNLDVTDGTEGGSCLPTATKVSIASTQRTFRLKRRVLEGPDFCVTDLRYSFQLRNQLEAIIRILTEYSKKEWEIRYRHDYWSMAGNKATATVPFPILRNQSGSTSFPGVDCPTSILTQGMLNRIKTYAIQDGTSGAFGMSNGAPLFTLVTDAATSDRIIYDDGDIRDDLRWGAPSELLKPFGVERSYRGFNHLIDPYPIRGTCSGNTFTEVAAFTTEPTTKGSRTVPNPAWESAPYQISFVFDPDVFHSLIPRPITDPHPDFKFNPVTYLGDWKLKNIPDRVCNPDGTIAFHRGHLGHAPMPVHPENGWAILHKRCDAEIGSILSCGS